MLARIKQHLKDNKQDNKLGVPNITFSIWKKEHEDLIPTANEIYDFCHQSIIGARIELIKPGNFAGEFILLDSNFLYAYALTNFDYPAGEYYETKTKIEGKLGIYRCVIDQKTLTSRVNIIPFKNKNKYDWEDDRAQEIIINSIDLDLLIKYKARVVVLDGIYWEDVTRPFNLLKELIQEAKNDDRDLAKLAVVSFSGKLTQKDYLHFSTFMYSYARRHIFENILNKVDVYLTNTDSALIEIKNLDLNLLGREMGKFKIEAEADTIQLTNIRKYKLYKNGKLIKSVG